jgi:nicotinamidase-related amidase
LEPSLQSGDALLVVDVQNDFCPGGALAVADGDRIVPVLNTWIDRARRAGAPIYASRCWHPRGHVSFRERGGPWPPHCVQNTPGAEFHPDLRLPAGTPIISKGTDRDRDEYSAFGTADLVGRLREHEVRRVFVGGLALDYCVRASVLDGLAAGFAMRLIRDATRPVDAQPGDGERAVAEMRAAGAAIE